MLLSHGGDKRLRCKLGKSALDYATEAGNEECVQAISEGSGQRGMKASKKQYVLSSSMRSLASHASNGKLSRQSSIAQFLEARAQNPGTLRPRFSQATKPAAVAAMAISRMSRLSSGKRMSSAAQT